MQESVPKGVNWDLWLGPRQPRPYSSAYNPVAWRDFWDFGTAPIGDFFCHNFDPACWALDLKEPISVEASSAGAVDSQIAPIAGLYTYHFPPRGKMPAVKFNWYEGGLMPPRPDGLEEDDQLGSGQRVVREPVPRASGVRGPAARERALLPPEHAGGGRKSSAESADASPRICRAALSPAQRAQTTPEPQYPAAYRIPDFEKMRGTMSRFIATLPNQLCEILVCSSTGKMSTNARRRLSVGQSGSPAMVPSRPPNRIRSPSGEGR